MCGRFAQTHAGADVAQTFQLAAVPELSPRYNIAPSQDISVIVQSRRTGDRLHHAKRWGLVPGWSKDVQIGNKLINARSETVADKPAFRDAFQRRRCLIVADGFYEWQQAPKGQAKQPHLIRLKARSLFAFAGLWERWRSPQTDELHFSCTILTTAANTLMAPIHHRMPVILPSAAYDVWLDPTHYNRGELTALLRPYEAASMEAIAIGTAINHPQNEGAAVQAPL
ncbi:SOS response-associated peptidase [Leptolyngbya iicbica]|uniref:Abasic site processing protein n=2 Tax=Cyanophyceae TaxID=3028117 RepID=A0A4Q7DZ06_9CYAN|nr:SOS response-associated peptidase [Leptolyngbya sp. LK]RZM74736.1 SOS response-associated peptidase [Leptolyngbya sp. LK]